MPSNSNALPIKHIAALANIPITNEEETSLAKAFTETIEVVNHLSELDTTQVEPTHQVTGLENIFRPDEVTPERMLSQTQALSNAAQTHQGYIVVPQIIKQD